MSDYIIDEGTCDFNCEYTFRGYLPVIHYKDNDVIVDGYVIQKSKSQVLVYGSIYGTRISCEWVLDTKTKSVISFSKKYIVNKRQKKRRDKNRDLSRSHGLSQ